MHVRLVIILILSEPRLRISAKLVSALRLLLAGVIVARVTAISIPLPFLLLVPAPLVDLLLAESELPGNHLLIGLGPVPSRIFKSMLKLLDLVPVLPDSFGIQEG